MIKRARIMDNNPLSQTDSVLDSFEQASQPASQLVDKSASQKDVELLADEVPPQATAKEDELLSNQEVRKSTS